MQQVEGISSEAPFLAIAVCCLNNGGERRREERRGEEKRGEERRGEERRVRDRERHTKSD